MQNDELALMASLHFLLVPDAERFGKGSCAESEVCYVVNSVPQMVMVFIYNGVFWVGSQEGQKLIQSALDLKLINCGGKSTCNTVKSCVQL